MADETPLQKAENKASNFINGGQCTIAVHPAATKLELLVVFRQIRLLEPHWSSNPIELEIEINRELRRQAGK